MVRRIFLVLENAKYVKLSQIKGDKTWEKLLVDDLLEKDESKKKQIYEVSKKIET